MFLENEKEALAYENASLASQMKSLLAWAKAHGYDDKKGDD